MRKFTLPFLFIFFAFNQVPGQTTLPNMNLEGWATDSTGLYEEPTGGVWTTANRAVRLNPAIFKVTTFKTSDAHLGSWAAKIVTDMAYLPGGQNLLLTGTLATGTFNELSVPPDNLKMGMPFNGRPTRFKTWFKYFPVQHDSCDMWCMLIKWNPLKMARDTIGVAWYTDTITHSQYYQLDMVINYYSGEIPDSISVVYAPSASGDLFLGQVGSTLYVDDITLEYSNGFNQTLMPEVGVKCYPSPAINFIRFELSEDLKQVLMRIFNEQGQLISSKYFSGRRILFDLTGFTPGTYYYLLSKGTTQLNSGTFLKTGH
jgi:hypothetical protein